MTTAREPKHPDALPWKAIAPWSDDAIYAHFLSLGRTPRHAKNSLKFLRARLGDGSAGYTSVVSTGARPRKPKPAPVPALLIDPEPAATQNMSQAMHATQSAIDEETRLANAAKVQAIRATHAHSAPANGKASDALAGLAAALAPLLGGNLHDLIREAVAEAMASFTPAATAQATAPGQVVVIEKGKEPRALSGIHHKQAGKIIKLAGQRGLNVLMVGPAGCGKTVLAKSVSQAHERPLTVISCSAGMSEAQLLGRLLPMGAGGAFVYVESPFMKAYANGGVILLDEIDAADSNLLLVINAALANGGVEIEARAASGLDTRVERHAETIILAAANTWGTGADTQYVGRAALDAATLDRFYRVAVDYDTDLERAVCENSEIVEKVQRMRSLAQAAKLRRVLSTRMIVRVDMATRAGIPMREAFADELAAWSADERSKVGA